MKNFGIAMLYNYLNNSHSRTGFSLGMRHMASVDMSGINKFLPFEANYWETVSSTKIIDALKEMILKQDKFLGRRKTSIKLSNYTISLEPKGGVEIRSDLKKGDMFSTCTVRADIAFVWWFAQHYDFEGFGDLEFTDKIYTAVQYRCAIITRLCVSHFHRQCSPSVNRRYFNPEVCARQLAMAFWSAQTVINAIQARGYDMLAWYPRRTLRECVYDFEDYVNLKKLTNFNYARNHKF